LISNEDALKKKISAIRAMGSENFQIMTDFDQTLTKLFYLDNRTADSSFRAILDSSFMPEEVKTLTRELFAKYHPMEHDVNMPFDEKEGHMLDWWHGNMKLI